MKKAFQQGWLDSLCGVYSVVNANAILHNATEAESQKLYNSIIMYLSKKRILKDVIIWGINHKWMVKIMEDVVGDSIPIKEANSRSIHTTNEWWEMATEHMESGEKRAILMSFDGRMEHYTVASSITEKTLVLVDSSYVKGYIIRKSSCRVKGYTKNNKYVIFPAQCWMLGL